MAYAKRVDNGQMDIVNTLRKLGMSVHVTSNFGFGFPDAVAAYMFKTYLIEIKDGNKCPSKQRLNVLEQKFHDDWQDKIYILNSVKSAIEFFNDIRIKNGC